MDGIVINKTWIQGKRPEPDCLGEFAYQGENLAHTINVSGKTATGTAVNVTGTIKGVYLGENNVSVPLTGSVNDGVASLTLTDDCYAIPGKFILSIYAQNTETLCIYCGIGHMFRTESERVPATSISDVLELIDRAQEVIDSIPEDYSALSAHFQAIGKFMTGDSSATADYSSAIGSGNTASGIAAFAEGASTKSTGGASHSEGDHTTASGMSAHAEGQNTVASGSNSHAEGSRTTASGLYSHVGGYSSVASGRYSHVHGLGVEASTKSQVVFGEYNEIEEATEMTKDYQRGQYAEIVGNGASASARSNARTLDWSGNEALSGDLTVNKGTENEMSITQQIQAIKQAIIALGGTV